MTTKAIEATVPEIAEPITQDEVARRGQTIIDPPSGDSEASPALIELTEQEAIDTAVEGLRELIEHKYHFCNRWDAMMGERLPAVIKRDQQQRIRYLAAIKVLQGLTWWEKQLGDS